LPGERFREPKGKKTGSILSLPLTGHAGEEEKERGCQSFKGGCESSNRAEKKKVETTRGAGTVREARSEGGFQRNKARFLERKWTRKQMAAVPWPREKAPAQMGKTEGLKNKLQPCSHQWDQIRSSQGAHDCEHAKKSIFHRGGGKGRKRENRILRRVVCLYGGPRVKRIE